MGNQALKLALKKNQGGLIFIGAFITSITLNGIGLFGGLGKTSFASGVASMVLLIPFSLLTTMVLVSTINDIRKDGINKKCVKLAFLNIAIVGGTILTGVSLFSELANNTIIGSVGFALLASSLLLFINNVAKGIKSDYEYNEQRNSSLRNVNSENNFENEVKTI